MRFATTDEEIRRCLPALRALRPHLEEATVIDRVRRQQQQGYCLAFLEVDWDVPSVAGFRLLEFLAWGRVLYIDDLVTLPEARGRGFGGSLLDDVIAYGRSRQCDAVHLDSGFGRHEAHRLYLNRRFRLGTHHFILTLDGKDEPPRAVSP